MSNNSRFPFKPQIASMPPEHQYVIRNLWNVISDVQDAVPLLKAQIDAKTTTGTASSSSSSTTTSTASETIINQAGGVTGGVVNNQTGVTTYTIQQSDNAGFIILDDASPIAVTLNAALTIPYFLWISNYGAGSATLTPSTGTISYPGNVGAASMPLASGYAAYLELDGTNWWAVPVSVSGSVVTKIIAGTNVNISPISGIGEVTVNVPGGTSGFNSGNNANGYWISDPLGHIHQWGVVNSLPDEPGIVTVSFPTPFTALSSIVVTANDNNHMGGNVRTIGTLVLSLSQFEVSANGSGANAYWVADGY